MSKNNRSNGHPLRCREGSSKTISGAESFQASSFETSDWVEAGESFCRLFHSYAEQDAPDVRVVIFDIAYDHTEFSLPGNLGREVSVSLVHIYNLLETERDRPGIIFMRDRKNSFLIQRSGIFWRIDITWNEQSSRWHVDVGEISTWHKGDQAFARSELEKP